MLRLITPATVEPVTLERAKRHLRIDDAEWDDALPSMIAAAREIVERQTGYALAAASYAWTPEDGRNAPLPIEPATVTSAAGDVPILLATTPGVAPAPLVAAILLLLSDQFTNTEASVAQALTENPAVQSLIFPYRRVLP